MSKKQTGPKSITDNSEDDEEDHESMKRHNNDLNAVWKKKSHKSPDKVVRLFSLTHKLRSRYLLEKPTTSRVIKAMEKCLMIMKPIYVSV